MFVSFDDAYIYSIEEVYPDRDLMIMTILSPEMETIKTKEYKISYFQQQLTDGVIVPYEK
jgi:hypothetical protein